MANPLDPNALTTSARANQFGTMAQSMPGQNKTIAQGIDEARKTTMQQAIAQTTATKSTAPAQAIGAQQAQAQGQTALSLQQTNQQQQANLGSTFLQQEREASANRLQAQAIDNNAKNFQEANRLGQLDANLKNQLFDSNLQFQKDELGRTIFNERQLMDYKLATAQSDEDLANYEQQVKQQSDRRMQMLQTAHAKIDQEMQQSFAKGQQHLDQQHMKTLYEAKVALDKKILAEKNKAANRAAMFSAGGSILGMAAGAAIIATGGLAAPAAAAVMTGAAAGGSGLGSVVGASNPNM